MILDSGIADLLERVLVCVRAKLAEYSGPLLLLHTAHDGLVDISHAERNLRWAGGEDKQLVVFPRGDHNSILTSNWDGYWEALDTFVQRLS